MTKLSERVPDPNYDQSFKEWRARLRDWLKELAEYVEFIDRRDRLAYRSLREQLLEPDQKDDVKYEPQTYDEAIPQTYDEAIALCKGWPRAAFGYDISWEKDKWPELWRELVGAKITNLYLSEITENRWVFNLDSVIYTDSTPGRVVCKAYLVYKGYPDWAKRLSK